MKNLLPVLLSCCLLAVFVSVTNAQQRQGDVYTLGTRKVRIPAPEGFVDSFGRFERIAGIFTSSEDPGNVTLAAHVPLAQVPQMEKGELVSLTYYTKVWAGKSLLTMDISPDMFPGIKAHVQKNLPQLVDADSAKLKALVANARRGLNEHLGTETGFDITGTKNLGYFNSTPNALSTLMLMDVQGVGGKTLLLCAVSIINVKNRILSVAVYRAYESDADAELVRDVIKKWTDEIVSANVPPPPPAPKKR